MKNFCLLVVCVGIMISLRSTDRDLLIKYFSLFFSLWVILVLAALYHFTVVLDKMVPKLGRIFGCISVVIKRKTGSRKRIKKYLEEIENDFAEFFPVTRRR